MKSTKILLLFLLSILITGCYFPVRMTQVIGSGNTITESRKVTNFTAVELSGVGTLIITQGGRESLEIIAEDNIMPHLESKIVGKNLQLGIKDNVSIDPKEEIIYKLTIENLERVEASGAGKIQIGSIICHDLDVEISGASDLTIEYLRADSFNLDISGTGNAGVNGEVQQQKIEISGAGAYQAGDLESDDARIEISGAGNAVIWVENELDVELSGTGTLKYFGSPILNTDMSGAGSIQSLGKK